MKKKLIVAVIMVIASAAMSSATEFTLSDCVETALKNHPDLAASSARIESATATIGQAKAGTHTQMDLSGSYTRGGSITGEAGSYGNYNTGFSLSQLLTDSGKSNLRIKKAQQNTAAAKDDLAEKRNDIICNVSDAYYSVNLASRECHVAQRRYDNYKKRLKWAEAYYKAGKKPKIEVTRAEADFASAKLTLITAKTAAQVAKAELASSMGDAKMTVPTLKDELDYEDWTITEDEAIQLALTNRPELLSKTKRIDAAKTEIGIQQKGMSPEISLGGGYSLSGSSFFEDRDWNARIMVSLPILDGGATNSRVAQAKADLKASEAERQSLENNVVLEVRTAWQNMVKAKESIVSAMEAERKEKANYELAEKRYQAGVGNSLEISDAVDSYALAETTTIRALYNAKNSQIALFKAIGGRK